jgi:LPS O-antigen subunit length determinant protein (WzzB/FepE family)
MDENQTDLVALWRFAWRHKLLITLVTLVGGLIAAALAWTTASVYRAEVVITEVHDPGMGASLSFANQLGGLASLAGVTLPQTTSADQAAQAVLNSRYLVEEFIKRKGLLSELYRASRVPPTLWRAVTLFKDGVLNIRRDTRKGITTVVVEWTDPATAAAWANEYVALANELLRTRALEDSNRNIAYLDGQLARTTDVELRKVMYSIIESETKTLMLANGRREYAFEVVDPAVAPEIKVSPHRALMTLIGLALGAMVGAAAALIFEKTTWYRPVARSAVRNADTAG